MELNTSLQNPQSPLKISQTRTSQVINSRTYELDSNFALLKQKMNEIKNVDAQLQNGIESTRKKLMKNISHDFVRPSTTRNSMCIENMRQKFTRDMNWEQISPKTTVNRIVLSSSSLDKTFQAPTNMVTTLKKQTLSQSAVSPCHFSQRQIIQNVQCSLQEELLNKQKRIEWLQYQNHQIRAKMNQILDTSFQKGGRNSLSLKQQCQKCLINEKEIQKLQSLLKSLQMERDGFKYRLELILKQKSQSISRIDKLNLQKIYNTNDSTMCTLSQAQIQSLKNENYYLQTRLKSTDDQLQNLQKSIHHRSTQGSYDYHRGDSFPISDISTLKIKQNSEKFQKLLEQNSNISVLLKQKEKQILEKEQQILRIRLFSDKLKIDIQSKNKQIQQIYSILQQEKQKSKNYEKQYFESLKKCQKFEQKCEKLEQRMKRVFERTEASSQVSGKPSLKQSQQKQILQQKQKQNQLLSKIKNLEMDIQYLTKQRQIQGCERKVYQAKTKELYQKINELNDQNFKLRCTLSANRQDESQRSSVIFINKNAKIDSLFSPERDVVASIIQSQIQNQDINQQKSSYERSYVENSVRQPAIQYQLKTSQLKESKDKVSLQELKLKREALMKKIESIAIDSQELNKQASQRNLFKMNSKILLNNIQNPPNSRSRTKTLRNSQSNFQIDFNDEPNIPPSNMSQSLAKNKIFKELWQDLQILSGKLDEITDSQSSQIQQMAFKINQLQQSNNQLYDNLFFCENHIDKLSEQCKQSVQALKQKQLIIEDLKTRLIQVEQKQSLNKLKNNNVSLQQSQIKELQNEVEIFRMQNKKLLYDLNQLKMKLQNINEIYQNKNKNQILAKITSSLPEELVSQNLSFQEAIENLVNFVKEMKEQVFHCNSQKQTYYNNLVNAENYIEKIQIEKAQIQSLFSQFQYTFYQIVPNMSNDFPKSNNLADDIRKSYQTLIEILKKNQYQFENLHKQICEKNQHISNLYERTQILTKEKQILLKQKSDIARQISFIKKKSSQLQVDFSQPNDNKEQMKSLKFENFQAQELKNQIILLRDENNKLKDQIDNINKKHTQQLQQILIQSESKTRQIQRKNREIQQIIRDKESIIIDIQNKKIQNGQIIRDIEEKQLEIQLKNHQLLENQNQFENRINLLQFNFQKQREDFVQRIRKLEKQESFKNQNNTSPVLQQLQIIYQLQAKEKQLYNIIQILTSEKAENNLVILSKHHQIQSLLANQQKLELQLSKLNKQNQILNSELKNVSKNISIREDTFKKEIEDLKQKKHQQSQEIEVQINQKIQQQIKKEKQLNKILNIKINQLETHYKQLIVQKEINLTKLNEKSKYIQIQINNMIEHTKTLNADIEILNEQIVNIKEKKVLKQQLYENFNKENNHIEQLQQLRKQVQKLEDQKKYLSNAIENKNIQISILKSSEQKFNQQKENLKQQLILLEQQIQQESDSLMKVIQFCNQSLRQSEKVTMHLQKQKQKLLHETDFLQPLKNYTDKNVFLLKQISMLSLELKEARNQRRQFQRQQTEHSSDQKIQRGYKRTWKVLYLDEKEKSNKYHNEKYQAIQKIDELLFDFNNIVKERNLLKSLLSNAENKIKQMDGHIANLQFQKNLLTKNNTELCASLSQAKNILNLQMKNFEQISVTLQKQKSELKQEKQRMSQYFINVEQNAKNVELLNITLEQKNIKLQEEIQILQKQKNNQEANLFKIKRENVNLLDQSSILFQKVNQLKKYIQVSELQKCKLLNDKKQFERKVQIVENENKELESSVNSTKNSMLRFAQEIKDLKQQLHLKNMSLKNVQQQNIKIKQQILSKKQQIKILKQKLQRNSLEIDNLNLEIQNYQKQLFQNNKELSSQNNFLLLEKQKLIRQNQILIHQNDLLLKQNQQLKKNNILIHESLALTNSQKEQLVQQFEKKLKQITIVQKQNEKLEHLNRQLVDEKEQLWKLNDMLSKQNETISNFNDQISKEKDLITKKILELQQQSSQNLNNLKLSQKELILSKKDIQQLNSTFIEQKIAYLSEKKSLIEQNNSLKSLNHNLEEQKKILIKQKDLLMVQMSILREQNSNAIQLTTTLLPQNNILIQEKNALISENLTLIEEKNFLIQENQSLINKNNSLVQENNKIFEEKKVILSQNQRLLFQNKRALQEQKRLLSLVDKQEIHMKKLSEQLDSCTQILKMKGKELEISHKDLKELKGQVIDLGAKLKELYQGDVENEHLTTENIRLVKQNQNLICSNRQLVDENDRLENQNQQLKKALLCAEKQISEWQNRLKLAEQHITYQEQYIDSLSKEQYDQIGQRLIKVVDRQKQKIVDSMKRDFSGANMIVENGILLLVAENQEKIDLQKINKIQQKFFQIEQEAQRKIKKIGEKINSRGNSCTGSLQGSLRGSSILNTSSIAIQTQIQMKNEQDQQKRNDIQGIKSFNLKINDEIQHYVKQNQSLRNQNLCFRHDHEELSNNQKLNQTKIHNIEFKVEELKELLKNEEEKLSYQKHLFEQKQKDYVLKNKNLQQSLSQLESKVSYMQFAHNEHLMTITTLIHKIQILEFEKKNALKKVESLQHQIITVHKQNVNNLKNKIQQLEEEHQEEKSQLQKQLQKSHRETKRKVECIAEITKQKTQLIEKIDQQNIQLCNVNKQLVALSQVSSKIQSGHDLIMEQLLKIDEVKKKMEEEYNNEINKLVGQIKQIDEQKKIKSQKLQNLIKSYEILESKYNKLRNALLSLFEQTSDFQKFNGETEDQQIEQCIQKLSYIVKNYHQNLERILQLQSQSKSLQALNQNYLNKMHLSNQIASHLEQELSNIYQQLQNQKNFNQQQKVIKQKSRKNEIFEDQDFEQNKNNQTDLKKNILGKTLCKSAQQEENEKFPQKYNKICSEVSDWNTLKQEQYTTKNLPIIKKEQDHILVNEQTEEEIDHQYIPSIKMKKRDDITIEEYIIMLERLVYQLQEQAKSFEFSIETLTQQIQIYQQKQVSWMQDQKTLSQAISQVSQIVQMLENSILISFGIHKEVEWLKPLWKAVRQIIQLVHKNKQENKNQLKNNIKNQIIQELEPKNTQSKYVDRINQQQAIQERYEQLIAELVEFESQNTRLKQKMNKLTNQLQRYQEEISLLKDSQNQVKDQNYIKAQQEIKNLKKECQQIKTSNRNDKELIEQAQLYKEKVQRFYQFWNHCLKSVQKLQINMQIIQSQSQNNIQKLRKIMRKLSKDSSNQSQSQQQLVGQQLSPSKKLVQQFRGLLHNQTQKQSALPNIQNEMRISSKQKKYLINQIKNLNLLIQSYYKEEEKKNSEFFRSLTHIQSGVAILRAICAQLLADSDRHALKGSSIDRLAQELYKITSFIKSKVHKFKQIGVTIQKVEKQEGNNDINQTENIVYMETQTSKFQILQQKSNHILIQNISLKQFKSIMAIQATSNQLKQIIESEQSEESLKQIVNIMTNYLNKHKRAMFVISSAVVRMLKQILTNYIDTNNDNFGQLGWELSSLKQKCEYLIQKISQYIQQDQNQNLLFKQLNNVQEENGGLQIIDLLEQLQSVYQYLFSICIKCNRSDSQYIKDRDKQIVFEEYNYAMKKMLSKNAADSQDLSGSVSVSISEDECLEKSKMRMIKSLGSHDSKEPFDLDSNKSNQ